jgi:hypothetical protein
LTESLQHFKDYVLGSDPWPERASQLYADYLRHFGVKRRAGHGHGYIEAAYPNSHHARSAGSRSMAIRAYPQFAWYRKAFKVHLMADAIPRLTIIYPILLGKRLKEAVIVAVFKSSLEDIMINIDGGVFYLDPGYAHCFKL